MATIKITIEQLGTLNAPEVATNEKAFEKLGGLKGLEVSKGL